MNFKLYVLLESTDLMCKLQVFIRAETNIRLVRIFARLHKYSNT